MVSDSGADQRVRRDPAPFGASARLDPRPPEDGADSERPEQRQGFRRQQSQQRGRNRVTKPADHEGDLYMGFQVRVAV